MTVTVYFESVNGLQFSGGHFAENRKHVHEIIEAEVPLAVLGERFHNPIPERVLLENRNREFQKV